METYVMMLWNNLTNKEIRCMFEAYPDEVLVAADEKLELEMIAHHTRSLYILQIKQVGYWGD